MDLKKGRFFPHFEVNGAADFYILINPLPIAVTSFERKQVINILSSYAL